MLPSFKDATRLWPTWCRRPDRSERRELPLRPLRQSREQHRRRDQEDVAPALQPGAGNDLTASERSPDQCDR